MAIIQAGGRGLEPLMQALLAQKQQEFQAEQIKNQQAALKVERERFEFERTTGALEAKAIEQAGQLLRQSLIKADPSRRGEFEGMSGSAILQFQEVAQGQAESAAQVDLNLAQTNAIGAGVEQEWERIAFQGREADRSDIRLDLDTQLTANTLAMGAATRDNMATLAGQNQQQIDLEAEFNAAQIINWDRAATQADSRLALDNRIAEATDANERTRLQIQRDQLESNDRNFANELVSRELTAAQQAAVTLGIPVADFYRKVYGTVNPNDIRDQILNDMEGKSGDELNQLAITRMGTGFGLSNATLNSLNEALFKDHISPQTFIVGVYNEESVEPETKDLLFMILNSVYPGLRVPPQVAWEPGRIQRMGRWIGGLGAANNTRLRGTTGGAAPSGPRPVGTTGLPRSGLAPAGSTGVR